MIYENLKNCPKHLINLLSTKYNLSDQKYIFTHATTGKKYFVTRNGFPYYYGGAWTGTKDISKKELYEAIAFLQKYAKPRKSIPEYPGSYSFKHYAENYYYSLTTEKERTKLSEGGYISNGAIIAAAIILGLKIKSQSKVFWRDPNAFININFTRSKKRSEKYSFLPNLEPQFKYKTNSEYYDWLMRLPVQEYDIFSADELSDKIKQFPIRPLRYKNNSTKLANDEFNCQSLLKTHYNIMLNPRTKEIELNGVELTENDITRIRVQFDEVYHITFTPSRIYKSIKLIAEYEKYNHFTPREETV